MGRRKTPDTRSILTRALFKELSPKRSLAGIESYYRLAQYSIGEEIRFTLTDDSRKLAEAYFAKRRFRFASFIIADDPYFRPTCDLYNHWARRTLEFYVECHRGQWMCSQFTGAKVQMRGLPDSRPKHGVVLPLANLWFTRKVGTWWRNAYALQWNAYVSWKFVRCLRPTSSSLNWGFWLREFVARCSQNAICSECVDRQVALLCLLGGDPGYLAAQVELMRGPRPHGELERSYDYMMTVISQMESFQARLLRALEESRKLTP